MVGGTGLTENEKSFGRRALERIGYITDKVWSILPVGSLEVSCRNKEHISTRKEVLKLGGHIIWAFIGIKYALDGVINGIWTPQYIENFQNKRQEKQHKEWIDTEYAKQDPLQNCDTKMDSINTLYDLGLEKYVEIKPISFKDKKRVLDGLVY